MEPLVSAVIVTYNQEKYISQTIECALAQKTDFDYEIVIGEDCSTDRTLEICYKYQEQYPDKIRVLTSDKNLGILDNWYRTVLEARGKYIAGCGGDDYWHSPEKLQKQVTFLEENPDYGMVHSDANMLFEQKGRLVKNYHQSEGRLLNSSSDPINLLFSGKYWIIAGSATFKKSIFDQYFNMEEIKSNAFLMEDIPLWFEISAHAKIHYMPESYMTYRRMEGTISNPYSHQKALDLWNSCYQCHLHYFKKYNEMVDKNLVDLSQIHTNFNRLLFKIAFKANNIKSARVYFRKIKDIAGTSYLTKTDRFRYCFTYFPFGTSIWNWGEHITNIIRKKGIPVT